LKEEDNNKKGLLLWLLSGRAQRQGDQITFGEWVSCRKKKKKRAVRWVPRNKKNHAAKGESEGFLAWPANR
jgi:hypothetical protein